jgi:hypothetical protein
MLLLACVPLIGVRATVLQQLGFEELVAGSELIITATVTGWRVEVAEGLQYTWVSFAAEDTLKGELPETGLELRFMGADLQGAPLHIEGQFIPVPGTRGVFFVADTANNQVNPLTGWFQGYFPLMQDGSGDDYLDLRPRPDLEVPGLEIDPLVGKMQGLGFSNEAIDAKLSRAYLFSWQDFRDAIVDVVGSTVANGGAAP